MPTKMGARLASEFLGTFWLVLGGCGSAIFAAKHLLNDSAQTQMGIGFLGVALAFGLTVVTMAYAVGHVSGAHFNPAITIGAAVGGRFPWKDVPAYVVAQVIGGLASGGVLAFLLSQSGGYETLTGNMAANGFDANSPGGYSLAAALVAEIILTMFFVWVVLGTTDGRAPKGFAPLAIGLALTLIHLISIPITNTSVNPARSTAVAFFNGDGAPGQLWLFWLAPIIGAILAGVTYAFVTDAEKEPIEGDVA